MDRYPPATWVGGATTYGPLPDHGKQYVKLVLHTTETRGMPGFSNGDTAPHLVYDPNTRTWTQWADFDRYVGTMKGHSSGHWNCQAIQVEIIAYSDRNAAQSVGGLWVGDFLPEHYADLAHLYRWLMAEGLTGLDLTPTPPGGWLYGTSSPHRLTPAQYDGLYGLTCHGAVPGNTHWDTGELDLEHLWLLATDSEQPPDPPDPTPPPDQEGEPMWPMYETDGYNSPSGKGRTAWRENVRVLQGMVNDAGGDVDEDGKLGPGTLAEVQDLTGLVVSNGTVTGAHANALARMGLPGGYVPHVHSTDGGVPV